MHVFRDDGRRKTGAHSYRCRRVFDPSIISLWFSFGFPICSSGEIFEIPRPYSSSSSSFFRPSPPPLPPRFSISVLGFVESLGLRPEVGQTRGLKSGLHKDRSYCAITRALIVSGQTSGSAYAQHESQRLLSSRRSSAFHESSGPSSNSNPDTVIRTHCRETPRVLSGNRLDCIPQGIVFSNFRFRE